MVRELLRPEKLDQSLSLHGLDYVDVPALGKRDYKLNFYSFKECTILARVHIIQYCHVMLTTIVIT